jgi:hypothetical protein
MWMQVVVDPSSTLYIIIKYKGKPKPKLDEYGNEKSLFQRGKKYN